VDHLNVAPNVPPSSDPPFSASPPYHRSLSLRLFFGPDGIRAGWRLLIFFAILAALAMVEAVFARFVLHRAARAVPLTLRSMISGEGGAFALVFVASWLMAKIENRSLADYGLPWARAFGLRFWQGLLVGFAAITTLLVGISALGAMHLGPIVLHGIELWKYAVLWAVAFLTVAFFEEFFFRGYMLFTLTTAIGFWPSAILCSIVFGYVHHSNPHENWMGAITAGLVGLVFCLLLRRTGNLWMPIGFHAAWDWGETYFYGVPDSGQLLPGHLFSANFNGPAWLTGGIVGPEGSWLCILLLLCLWFVFGAWLREARYPLNTRHVETYGAENA
jgi:membrane protease YdiL (CAAX protease family)